MGQLGTMLRTAREDKGVSLAQAEAATMIRRSYLQALEDDEHALLPGAVYTKGFLRNYAVYLGLDASQALSVYHREYADPSQNVIAPASIKPRGTRQLVTGGTLATLALVVVVAFFSTYVYRQVQSFREAQPSASAGALVPTPTPIPPTATAGPAATQTALAAAAIPTEAAPTATATPNGAEVVAKVSRDSWFSIEIDGQPSFQGVLKAGQTQTWKGKDDVFVWTGNAGGVSIVFNGQDLGTLGAVGQVVKKDFKKV